MKLIAKGILIWFAFMVNVGCGRSTQHAPSGVVAYGSSLSVGFINDDEVPYPALVAKRMGKAFMNHARGGSSMFDPSPAGFPSQNDMIAQDAWDVGTIILWDVGINDSIYHGHDPEYLAQFEAGLTANLKRMQAAGAIVYVGTTIHNCDEPRFVLNSDADQYAAIARKVVASLKDPNIRIVDYNAGFNPTEANTRDCLHPNQTGHGQIADFFFSAN